MMAAPVIMEAEPVPRTVLSGRGLDIFTSRTHKCTALCRVFSTEAVPFRSSTFVLLCYIFQCSLVTA